MQDMSKVRLGSDIVYTDDLGQEVDATVVQLCGLNSEVLQVRREDWEFPDVIASKQIIEVKQS